MSEKTVIWLLLGTNIYWIIVTEIYKFRIRTLLKVAQKLLKERKNESR